MSYAQIHASRTSSHVQTAIDWTDMLRRRQVAYDAARRKFDEKQHMAEENMSSVTASTKLLNESIAICMRECTASFERDHRRLLEEQNRIHVMESEARSTFSKLIDSAAAEYDYDIERAAAEYNAEFQRANIGVLGAPDPSREGNNAVDARSNGQPALPTERLDPGSTRLDGLFAGPGSPLSNLIANTLESPARAPVADMQLAANNLSGVPVFQVSLVDSDLEFADEGDAGVAQEQEETAEQHQAQRQARYQRDRQRRRRRRRRHASRTEASASAETGETSTAASSATGATGTTGPAAESAAPGPATDPAKEASSKKWTRADLVLFTCPITQEVMHEPVSCPEGYSFERSAIIRWLESNPCNPLTRTTLQPYDLVPNRSLKSLIEAQHMHDIAKSLNGEVAQEEVEAGSEAQADPTRQGSNGSLDFEGAVETLRRERRTLL